MKAIFILLICFGALGYYLKSKREGPPVAIDNPVYAETSTIFTTGTHSIKMVVLTKAINEADCQSVLKKSAMDPLNAKTANPSVTWKEESAVCKTELPAKYSQLFENKPAALTYLAIPRVKQADREIRAFSWGISVEESNKMCDFLATTFQGELKTKASCIRAAAQ